MDCKNLRFHVRFTVMHTMFCPPTPRGMSLYSQVVHMYVCMYVLLGLSTLMEIYIFEYFIFLTESEIL